MIRAEAGTMSARNLALPGRASSSGTSRQASWRARSPSSSTATRSRTGASRGSRDRERGTPDARRHDLPHLLDDQADRVGRADAVVRARACSSSTIRSDSYIPSWKNLRVYQARRRTRTSRPRPCERPMTVRDLLSHQSGLTATASSGTPRGRGVSPGRRSAARSGADGRLDAPGSGRRAGGAAAGLTRRARAGSTRMSTDIVGLPGRAALRAAASTQYLQEHIFEPLGMTDTGFWVQPRPGRPVATNYRRRRAAAASRSLDDPARARTCSEPTFLSGSGGLVSTAGDYLRFSRMLLGKGTLDGAAHHRAEDARADDPEPHHRRQAIAAGGARRLAGARSRDRAYGFGLGFAVALDTADGQVIDSARATTTGRARPAPTSGSIRPRIWRWCS